MRPPQDYIEVRGQRFTVKQLTIEEEGQVVALRDRLAGGKWGHFAASESADDRGWAVIFDAAARLQYTIVEAPEDFPGATKLNDPDFLFEIHKAYQEKMIEPFRPKKLEESKEESEGLGEAELASSVVSE